MKGKGNLSSLPDRGTLVHHLLIVKWRLRSPMRVGSAPVGKPAARRREEVNQPPLMTTTVTLTLSSLLSILAHAIAHRAAPL